MLRNNKFYIVDVTLKCELLSRFILRFLSDHICLTDLFTYYSLIDSFLPEFCPEILNSRSVRCIDWRLSWLFGAMYDAGMAFSGCL